MKKLILAAFMLVSVSAMAFTGSTAVHHSAQASGNGRHISASQVPVPVMTSFNALYPNATNVSWEVQREHGAIVYQAKFKQNGKCFKATFSADGTFLSQKRINC